MRSFTCLEHISGILMHNYCGVSDQAETVQHIKALLCDWDAALEVANNNRVFSNLVAVLYENKTLLVLLSSDQQTECQRNYLVLWRRAEQLKMQLLELSTALPSHGHAQLVLMKGAARLFDGMYPSLIHRFMADIDLYFEDEVVLKSFDSLGYKVLGGEGADLATFDAAYVEAHARHNHHLPPLFHKKHPARIELHHHLAPLGTKALVPKDVIASSSKIDCAPGLGVSSTFDQLIVTLVHSQYGDRFTNNVTYRLRGVIEAYLLYKRLSDTEKSALEAHFDERDKGRDFLFWQYLCLRLLDASEFGRAYPWQVRLRFFWFRLVNQNMAYHAMLYNLHFVYRFLTDGLWRRDERKRLMRNMVKPEHRRVFFDKLKTAIGL